jgi:hypothetical protein
MMAIPRMEVISSAHMNKGCLVPIMFLQRNRERGTECKMERGGEVLPTLKVPYKIDVPWKEGKFLVGPGGVGRFPILNPRNRI